MLHGLSRVQELHGEEAPFYRLRDLLKTRDFDGAGIDAPFSVPVEYMPPGGHRELLQAVADMKRLEGRCFPGACDFANGIKAGRKSDSPKALRQTEMYWRRRGVNVRSTLWAGPRGGSARLQYGLIAEEVAKVYPELVAYGRDGTPYSVRCQYLSTMLLNELQKQNHRAEAQAALIRAQQGEIDGLKHELQLQKVALEERLSRLEAAARVELASAK
jgi:hypothetical protein